MYQRNQNLFSFLAILITAGVITGVGGLFLVFVDQLGGAPQPLSSSADIRSQESDGEEVGGEEIDGEEISDVGGRNLGGRNLEDIKSLAPAAFAAETSGTREVAVLSVSASADSPLVASGSDDNMAQLWDRNTRMAIPLPHSGQVSAIAFSDFNDLLVTGSSSGDITLWFTPSGQLSDTASTNAGAIQSVAVATKGKTVATGSTEGKLTLWTITAGSNLQQLATLPSTDTAALNAVAFHPTDSNVVISGDQNGLIQVWDVAQAANTLTIASGPSEVVSLAVSRNGQYIASGSADKTIRLWDLATGELLQVLTGHNLLVSAVAFTAGDSQLVSSSYDASVKVWEWTQGSALCTLNGHSGPVYSVAVADSGDTLVSGGEDGTVRLWDLTAPEYRDCSPS